MENSSLLVIRTCLTSAYMLVLLLFTPISVHAGIAMIEPPYRKGEQIDVLFLNGELADQGLVAAIANEWTYYALIDFKFHFTDDLTMQDIARLEQKKNTIVVKFNRESNHWTQVTNFYGNNNYAIALTGVDPATILHEFGHALGLKHEHQHPSARVNVDESLREEVCNSLGWSKASCESNIFKKLPESEYRFTSYDEESIMHYSFDASMTNNGLEYTQNNYMSFGDVMVISKMYPQRLYGKKAREIKKLIRNRASVFGTNLTKTVEDSDDQLIARLTTVDGEPVVNFYYNYDPKESAPRYNLVVKYDDKSRDIYQYYPPETSHWATRVFRNFADQNIDSFVHKFIKSDSYEVFIDWEDSYNGSIATSSFRRKLEVYPNWTNIGVFQQTEQTTRTILSDDELIEKIFEKTESVENGAVRWNNSIRYTHKKAGKVLRDLVMRRHEDGRVFSIVMFELNDAGKGTTTSYHFDHRDGSKIKPQCFDGDHMFTRVDSLSKRSCARPLKRLYDFFKVENRIEL